MSFLDTGVMIAFFIQTNDLKSVSSPEEIANEFFSLTLSVKENSFSEETDSPKKLRMLTKISHKNINPIAHLNEDCLHPDRKGQ